MRFAILSYFLDVNTPLYGNTPKPEITSLSSQDKGDSSNTYRIALCNHSCTHVDAPMHFVKGGKSIDGYSIDDLTFNNPAIVEIPKKPDEWIEKEDLENLELGGKDCLIIKTGFGNLRDDEVYRLNNPGISPEAILLVRRNFKKIRSIGIDTISVSGFQNRPRGREAHRAAFEKNSELGEPLLLVEDMNLSALENMEKVKRIIIVPWLIKNIDSAPCTVLAEVV